MNCDSWASCIHQRETLNIVAYTVARVSYWIAISHVLFKCLCCDVTRFNLSNWWRHTQSIYVTRICAALHTVFLDRFWFHIVNIKIMESMSPMIVIVMASILISCRLLVINRQWDDVIMLVYQWLIFIPFDRYDHVRSVWKLVRVTSRTTVLFYCKEV